MEELAIRAAGSGGTEGCWLRGSRGVSQEECRAGEQQRKGWLLGLEMELDQVRGRIGVDGRGWRGSRGASDQR